MVRKLFLIVLGQMPFYLLFPALCLADKIDGGGEFDALLIAIIDLLNGPILTTALVFSIVGWGISLALFEQRRELLEKGGRIVIGLIIAAKGAGFVAGVLDLSFLV
jgi:type IV secretory pathway VirB2 component (pilin)